ncbi:MAG TPA: 3-keto-5-aminohexanoate cleavage protein [Stellaceae bacterium]|nr:3-keto-5-aminohexanoate cleavage protein [Stellaceae bacterium]
MAQKLVWLEAALNGPWSRSLQPGIPVRVEEIVAEGIACGRAGAAIVHVHAYDAATGRQKDDPDLYAAIIEGIRGAVDAIVYPTIPLAGGSDAPTLSDPATRYAAVEALARRGLLEWAVVDPGSANFALYDWVAAEHEGFVYLNPESHIRHGLALAQRFGFHPAYACYEAGFARLGAALHRRYPGAPAPIYRFMFSEAFTFGFPPEPFALPALTRLLEREAPGAPWMLGGLGVDVLPLIPHAVPIGGHVRVGLEDAPFGSPRSNLAWVEAAAQAIESAGGRLATAGDIRAALRPAAASRP